MHAMVYMTQEDVLPQPIQNQIQSLNFLCEQLKKAKNIYEKLEIIDKLPHVKEFLKSPFSPYIYFKQLDAESDFVLKSVIAIGQGLIVFKGLEPTEESKTLFLKLIATLNEVEQFYETVGGIVGYHLIVLKLIAEKGCRKKSSEEEISYFKPEGIDFAENSKDVQQAVRWGIEHLKDIAEIYPLGGAADRLQLKDEINGESLPSAQLLFGGRTLLEGLIRDLQGREYLYYKLFDEQVTTPIAMMTSHEKNNHARITQLFEINQWFGRSPMSFKMFIQPLVPVITVEGNWVMSSKLQLMLKPGGHGAIWKKAIDEGVFEWLKGMQRNKALVRQINNPVAGVDNGLLGLAGIGCEQDKDFGFASCFRRLNTPEGMNVLIEKKSSSGYEYCISNIEYTDFEQHGVEDVPESPGSLYSRFPANTNILFVDLQAIEQAIKICPIPGMLINMKSTASTVDCNGRTVQIQAGRLESTMQNIADAIVDRFPHCLKEGQQSHLSTFLTYNLRRKTLSVTKEIYNGKRLIGTPEGCFYELLQDYHELLANFCQMEVPPVSDEQKYIEEGPVFIADFHPALGVLYHVIGQKIRGGLIAPGSEWEMEIAEADVENLHLNGSLRVHADQVLGHKDANGLIVYGPQSGKCVLKNVSVVNKGIDRTADNNYWKKQISRHESLEIILHGNAEFFAENVTFQGNARIEVPNGYRMTAIEKEGELALISEKIVSPSRGWRFAFGPNDQVVLSNE